MNDSNKKNGPHALPDEHPAKIFEDFFLGLAPFLAQGLYGWIAKPRRPPLAARLTMRAADRLIRTGNGLHAFVDAYRFGPPQFFSAVPPSGMSPAEAERPQASPEAPATSASKPHVNGVGTWSAATEGSAS